MSTASRWKLRDIVVLAVVAALLGVLWFGWTYAYEFVKGPLRALHPGLSYLLVGFWFTGGTVVPYLIRRPGAALAGELVAAGVQGLITQWGWTSLLWGLVQGLGSEAAFAATRYKKWSLGVFVAAGVVAGLFSWCLDFFYENYLKLDPLTWLVQVVAASVSGALLAGVLAWVLGRGLEKAGIRPSGAA